MPERAAKPLKQWTWKATVNGDPCIFYCDLTQNLELDFYGDSHHPLWKGWFDVGRQSPAGLVAGNPAWLNVKPTSPLSSAAKNWGSMHGCAH